MSVTTEGVKGYEYQYKVTVLMALISDAEKINLYVEKDGSEDALLIIENKGITQYIEIQVKRENNPINISKLVNWLSHFQERKSNNNLLQRLINSKQNIALFVTHSRCSDTTLSLKVDFSNLEKHNSISFSIDWLNEFKNVLKNQNFGKTNLMKQREAFCQKQSDDLKTLNDINSVFEQCLILEEFTDINVDSYINSLLNSKFNIAQSKVLTVYLKLLEIIKQGRDTGNEVYQEIMSCIDAFKIGIPKIDPQYKIREEEQKLINKLEKDGILLLTGVSQCGKSELAKKISSHFVIKGFDYQIFDDVLELTRFLSSNTSDNKIAILEDPFGHITLKENYFETLRKLQTLFKNKEIHHLVIVSSRIEIQYDVFNTNNIEECGINNHIWHDLTIKNKDTINLYWKSLSEYKALPQEIVTLVSIGILESRNEDLLQIGQLTYLINEEIHNLENKKFDELQHIARRDSKEIANHLKNSNEYAADILSLICICSTPIRKLSFFELKYILSENSDFLSIIDKEGFSAGGNNIPIFPEYPQNIELTEKTNHAINYLEERGLISLSLRDESLLISHPNFYEAGRYLFYNTGTLKLKKNLEQYKKCIACLNPITAFQASRNYFFIFNKIKNELKKEILNIALWSMDSIFPSVEDNSIIFLTNFIQEFEGDKYEKLIEIIQHGGTRDYYIYWHDNIPFISTKGHLTSLSILRRDKLDLTIIHKVESQLSSKILPNIHDAWIYIEGLYDKYPISKEKLCLLLQFNEAFIRQKVVYQFFSRTETLDSEIIIQLFKDEHPSVVFSAIRASFLNWFSLSEQLREIILKLVVTSFSMKQVAIRAYNLISTFSIDYGHESIFRRDFNDIQKKEMWQIWGKLYPICIANIPLGVRINPARFGATMDKAIKYLDLEIGMTVLKSWYERIDYQIKNNKILDEYEMSIADNLMKLTITNFEARKDIFPKLINYNDTNFILSNLKWIIGYWDELDISEKSQIIELINSDRKDIRWIKAVLLTTFFPPKEVVQHILGENDLFEKDIKLFLSKFSNQLLRDCLNVYCGFPQPLWWLAVHHNNKEFWNNIIKYILLDEEYIGFDICLEEFVSDGVNGFSLFKDDEGRILWKEICSKTQNKKTIAISLINNLVDSSCSIDTTQYMWATLINAYRQNSNINGLIAIIQENIELIWHYNKEDFLEVIDESFFKDELVPALDSLKLTNVRIEQIGKIRKEEIEKIFKYKLDNWIGIN